MLYFKKTLGYLYYKKVKTTINDFNHYVVIARFYLENWDYLNMTMTQIVVKNSTSSKIVLFCK